MSMEMYNRSKVRYQNAKDNVKNASAGGKLSDAFLDTACFDTQQAIEFILKAVLMQKEVRFEKEHDILYLLGLVEESGFVFERIDELKLLAATITSWEEKARYSTGIKTKEHTIYRVLNIYDEIEKAFLALL